MRYELKLNDFYEALVKDANLGDLHLLQGALKLAKLNEEIDNEYKQCLLA